MSSVLYEAPGPRSEARHRRYSVIATVALVILLALVGWRMYDTGQFAYELWEPFVTPAFIEAILLKGLWQTLQMAFLSIIFAVIFGLVFGMGKLSDHRWIRWPAWLIVEFFRAVPLLLLMVYIFLTYGVGDGFGSYWSVVIALTLYNGSVLAEVFRAGINAVPQGQAEAAYAIGMRKSQAMTIVLLPQGVKIMLPAIISQMVVALKDTSLGFYILAPGLTAIGKQIYTQFSNQLQTVIVVAALYIIANLVLSAVATWIQHKFVGTKRPMLGTDAQTGGGPANVGPGLGTQG
jgi:glutamate transport system permease protein